MEVLGTSSANVQSIKVNSMKTEGEKFSKGYQAEDQQKNQQPKKEEIEKVVKQVNQWVQQNHPTALHYVLHEKLEEYYVQVIDEKTDKVIREIPPKKFLDMHASTLKLLGLLVDEKV